jgi:hypothetical protein
MARQQKRVPAESALDNVWARRNGVGVDFDERKIRIGGVEHDVLYLMFAAGRPNVE